MENIHTEHTMNNKLKTVLSFTVKLLLAGGIIYFMIHRDAAQLLNNLKTFNYIFLLPAGTAYLSHMIICGWRWYKLAGMIQVELPFKEALALTMEAYFFSLVIPGGAIGGDVARVAAISVRAPHGRKAEANFTILMDRIIGMVALFSLAIVLCLLSIPMLMRLNIPGLNLTDTSRVMIILMVIGLCLSGLGAMLVLFFHKQLRAIGFINRLMNFGDLKSHGMVSRLTATIDLYRKQWRELTFLTIVSIFGVHIMTVVAVMFVIMGLGVFDFNYIDVLTAVTIGNIVGLIPFTISGLGLRDEFMLWLLTASGITLGSAVPLLYSGLIVFFNLFGGLFFIFDPGHQKKNKQEKI